MQNQEGEIRIYAACLAAYNNGILHGCWINAEQDADDIRAAISVMLRASPIEDAEEWAIHDYEGFEGARLSENEGIDQVVELAAFIGQHGDLGGKLLAYFGSIDEAGDALSDRYAGEYSSLADFAQEMTESSTEIPEALRYYIDWDSMARDMEINDVLAIHTGLGHVHVFWSH